MLETSMTTTLSQYKPQSGQATHDVIGSASVRNSPWKTAGIAIHRGLGARLSRREIARARASSPHPAEARPPVVTDLHAWQKNRLLSALMQADLQRLLPHLELTAMPRDCVLYNAGQRPAYAYFPTSSLVSMQHLTADGGSVEIALVGNDGMLGVALLMGGESMPSSAVVISAGFGYRLKSEVLKKEFNEAAGTRRLLLRYAQALFTQAAQTAICNRCHTIEQQLCRFLLLGLDRQFSNHLSLTQELIANMLGVRREGISEAAGKLKDARLIQYHHGHITVLNRPRLEELACECYAVVRCECERLLAPPAARHQHSAALGYAWGSNGPGASTEETAHTCVALAR